jgi:hypothetical protein
MTLKQFERLISKHKEFNLGISELYHLGFDFHEGKYKLCTLAENIFTTAIEANYGKDGVEWVDWYIYETNYATDDQLTAHDADGNRICYDVESLYNYLEKTCKN